MLDKQFLWPYHSKAAEGSGPPGDVSGRSASGRSAALSGQHCNFQLPNAVSDILQVAALVAVHPTDILKHPCGVRLQGAALVAVRTKQTFLNIIATEALQGAALVAVRNQQTL